jgi:hypothetical protein
MSALMLVAPLGASAGGSPAPVQPFEAIQAGMVRFTLNPSGMAATIEVETTIDAACAVVFGEDESFGRIATDTDMQGGAHHQHHVLLADLRPDTVYVLRFQGSGEDGQLYRSETMSFRTPVAAVGSADNLALDASVADVSSEFSSGFAAGNAIDGDLATEWSSSGDGDDAFITLDLGRPTPVGGVVFRTRAMSDGSATAQTFLVIADGRPFGPFRAGPEPARVDVTARELRFEIDSSTGGNTGAVEIGVYAPSTDRP